jgi:hypothetical protein
MEVTVMQTIPRPPGVEQYHIELVERTGDVTRPLRSAFARDAQACAALWAAWESIAILSGRARYVRTTTLYALTRAGAR